MTTTPRVKTLMFADISGSTRLFERLGDVEAGHAVDRCINRMRRSIEGYKGRTLQVAGDELFAAFESAEDACLAAIDMQERTADLPPTSGMRLTIRIGLHPGEVRSEGEGLVGDAVSSAARIAGLAKPEQILASSRLLEALPPHLQATINAQAGHGQIEEVGVTLALYEVPWVKREGAPVEKTQAAAPVAGEPSERLCIRYRGKAFLLDDKTQLLTLGRDPHSKLLIADRKASRQHGRIERRGDGYHYVDTSTNGSFVSFGGKHEIMLRHDEVLLRGRGRICFGASGNDPKSDYVEFEPL